MVRVWLILLVATGCGPTYIEGTKIEHTSERQDIFDLVERYRIAMEQRDTAVLRSMASRDYFENASTTDEPGDDYDFGGLERVFEDLKGQVKTVRYEIEPTDIQVFDNSTAFCDYRYSVQYLYTAGEQDHWGNVNERNRLTFRREDGKWRILSGM